MTWGVINSVVINVVIIKIIIIIGVKQLFLIILIVGAVSVLWRQGQYGINIPIDSVISNVQVQVQVPSLPIHHFILHFHK